MHGTNMNTAIIC